MYIRWLVLIVLIGISEVGPNAYQWDGRTAQVLFFFIFSKIMNNCGKQQKDASGAKDALLAGQGLSRARGGRSEAHRRGSQDLLGAPC